MIEFLNNLGINSTSGLIGMGLLILGFFLIFAGFGIISIEKVTVKQGKATWIVGIVIAVIGGLLFSSEMVKPEAGPDSPAIVEEIQISTPTSPPVEEMGLSDWRTIQLTLPSDNLWQEKDGFYTAVGSKDTIAWTKETYAGDIEISLDIESPDSFAGATVIVYGNGISYSPGNLIFTAANDLLAIWKDSIYGEGNFLFDSFTPTNFDGEKHTVLMKIVDRKASLFLDGDLISSVFLNEEINTSGRIGLLKYWEFSEITYSNIRVKGTGTTQ